MSRRNLSFLLGLAFFAVLFGGSKLSGFSNFVSSTSSQAQEAAVYTIVPSEPVTLLVQPDAGVEPLLSKIGAATSSVDLVMYELQDRAVEQALVDAENRGVKVRVLLNGGLYGSGSSANTSAYNYLQAHGVAIHWTPAYFALTHQKTLITDNSDALIMTFNLTPKYYSTSRDFAIDDPDMHDVAAIEQVFADDWNGTKETSPTGDDLVWSPGSKEELLAMIDSAKKSLQIYNEELSDPDIVSALQNAAKRGVSVQILMTDESTWHDAFTAISNAGGEVRTYNPKAVLYIHAKMILADGIQAFIGSENFSTASLDSNRELGLFVSNATVLHELATTFNSDWVSQDAQTWQ